MAAALEHGDSLILFPEGTRNTTERALLPFKSGLYRLASARPRGRVVPVWIENLNRVMPKGEFVPIPLLCTRHVRRAARACGAGEDKAAFLERARDALLALRADARRPADDRRPSRRSALFAGVAGVLVVASVVGFVLERRYAAQGRRTRSSTTSTRASRRGG